MGSNDVVFHNVRAGSTLVLLMYGYMFDQAAGPKSFRTPTDSQNQTIDVAVEASPEGFTPAVAWVLHDALPGSHTWTGLPTDTDDKFVDGKLFFVEFHREGHRSSEIVGGNSAVVRVFQEPWLTNGNVTMSASPRPGDLLVAFSFEEESGVGNPVGTNYTDPPAGWNSLGSQQLTMKNIGGAACWRIATSAQPQRVEWTWDLFTPTNGPQQDPSTFKGIIFAVR